MRYGGQWVVGTSLGLYFTPQVATHIVADWGALMFAVSIALGMGIAGAFWLARFGGVDFRTAWFCAAIGGAAEMSNIAEQRGARVDMVATAHSLRMLIVVCTVPFLFTMWGVAGTDPTQPGPKIFDASGFALLVVLTLIAVALFRQFHLPSPWMLGTLTMALLLTVNDIELSSLPQVVVVGGQVLIGWSLGDRYRPGFFQAAPRFMLAVTMFTLGALLLAAFAAWVASYLVDIALPVLILSMVPGGIAEISLTARALQLGTPIVTAFQVTRLAVVVVITGPLYDLLSRHYPNILGRTD
jgi:membrane AbrB-like protein